MYLLFVLWQNLIQDRYPNQGENSFLPVLQHLAKRKPPSASSLASSTVETDESERDGTQQQIERFREEL